MNADNKGGYQLGGPVDGYLPTDSKETAQKDCSVLNDNRTDRWHYFQVFQLNEQGVPISPSTGDVIPY